MCSWVRPCRTACEVLLDGDLSGPCSGQSFDQNTISRNFDLLNDQLPVGSFQRTIPRSNRLEILHMRFFLISDVLKTTVFARTHLGRICHKQDFQRLFSICLDDIWS